MLCADGYSSSLAALRLWELGYTSTTDVIGFGAWLEAALPTTTEGTGPDRHGDRG